jgi:hypothetical protein
MKVGVLWKMRGAYQGPKSRAKRLTLLFTKPKSLWFLSISHRTLQNFLPLPFSVLYKEVNTRKERTNQPNHKHEHTHTQNTQATAKAKSKAKAKAQAKAQAQATAKANAKQSKAKASKHKHKRKCKQGDQKKMMKKKKNNSKKKKQTKKTKKAHGRAKEGTWRGR